MGCSERKCCVQQITLHLQHDTILINCRMWTTFPQTHILHKKKSQLKIFEDNDVVIKMNIKGRSPTMRHESRTHRVAFGWLCDRIKLDPKIQIKYVDIKSQLTDMSTKRSFTRDEWNHLFRFFFNIMNFSMFSCSHFSQTEIREPCQKEVKKVLPKKVRQ